MARTRKIVNISTGCQTARTASGRGHGNFEDSLQRKSDARQTRARLFVKTLCHDVYVLQAIHEIGIEKTS
jgi:hypothetical protein